LRAIIVAAGTGNRLRPFTENLPKCLIKVGKETILEHQFRRLTNSGINKITMVLGFKAEMIEKFLEKKKYLGASTEFIYNPFYEITNNLASLWFANHLLKNAGGDIIHLHSDVLFDHHILGDMLKTDGDLILAAEEKRTVEEDMKIRVVDNHIVEMAKEIPIDEAYGEWIGMCRFSPEGSSKLADELGKVVRSGDLMAYDAKAFTNLARRGEKLKVSPTGDYKWIEIDSPDDLETAKKIKWT